MARSKEHAAGFATKTVAFLRFFQGIDAYNWRLLAHMARDAIDLLERMVAADNFADIIFVDRLCHPDHVACNVLLRFGIRCKIKFRVLLAFNLLGNVAEAAPHPQ